MTVSEPRTATEAPDPAVLRHAYAVLGVTSLGLMVVIMSGTAINVALPALSSSLHAGAGLADWFLLSFMLAQTSFILVFGRLSDMLGRRRVYLWGLVAFTLLSVAAVFAPSAGWFIVIRAAQGIAAATTVANTSALVARAFPASKLAYGLGLNFAAASVATTIGPTLGGVLTDAFGWQAVFLVNVPFGAAAIVLGLRVIRPPAPGTSARHERFDLGGALLVSAGLVCLLFAVNRVSESGIGDPLVWVLGASGVLLLVGFGVVETRVSHPLVDLSLVRDPSRGLAYTAAFFNSFARGGITVLAVLELEIVQGRSAASAGIIVMAMAVGMAIGSPIAARYSERVPVRTLLTVSGGLFVVGLLGLAWWTGGTIVGHIAWLFVVGFAIGAFATPNTTAIMVGVAPNRATVANAIRSTLFNGGQAIGTSVTLLLITASGITDYAQQDSSAAVVSGFRTALIVLAVSAAGAAFFSVVRRGPWWSARR
jgi:EmrB/QacA subfamily drug resistance transporter